MANMDTGSGGGAVASSGGGGGFGQQAGAGAGSVVGGLIGRIASNSDRVNARNSMNAAADALLSVGLPPDLTDPVAIEYLKQVGIYTPQLEQAIDLQQSEVSQIQDDPQLKAAQMSALSSLAQRSQSGLTPQQKAQLQQQLMQTEADERSREASLVQEMQARGQGGAGAELAARLQNSQSSANRANQAGMDQTGIATNASLNALSQYGQLGGQIRSQDFNEENTKASAEDLRNRFNVTAAQDRQTRNVGAGNTAEQANLKEAQRIADTNTNMKNQEAYRQNQAQRDYWNDLNKRAQTQAQGYGARAGVQQGEADDTSGLWSGLGTALGGVAGSVASGGK